MALYTHNRGDKKYLSNLSEQTVLSMTVSYVQTLSVVSRKVCRLATEDLKPILSVLERRADSLKLLDRWSPWTGVETDLLYILHRLLDHGSVKDVEMGRCYGLDLQNWITTRCRRIDRVGPHLNHESVELPVAGTSAGIQGTEPRCSDYTSVGPQRSGSATEEVACKRRRITWLWDMPTEFPCDTFLPKCGPICPKGQINSLDMQVTPFEITNVVSPSLPFWLCLHTLHLHNESTCQYLSVHKHTATKFHSVDTFVETQIQLTMYLRFFFFSFSFFSPQMLTVLLLITPVPLQDCLRTLICWRW